MKLFLFAFLLACLNHGEAHNLDIKLRYNTWKAKFDKRNEDPVTEEKR
jgi:hypothetical protein